jgi:hypothetical protein
MSEPKVTLHSQKWSEARQRVHAMDAITRPVFASLLDHMEQGWQAFRPLRLWFEQNSDPARNEADDYAHLLHFVDGELSDVFQLIGLGVADLVPGWPGWEAEADPADAIGWTESLRGNLAVFRLACTAADVPEQFRTLGLSVARTMEAGGWCEQLSALLSAAGELVPDATD